MVNRTLYWVFQFLCWAFISLIASHYSYLMKDDNTLKITLFFSYLIVGQSIGYYYYYLVDKLIPDGITTAQFFSYPVVGSICIGFSYTLIYYLLGGFKTINYFEIIIIFFETIWIVIPCFFFYHLYHFSIIYQDRKQRTLDAENQLQISELENLKKQLNPHFLFNALNSIKALTISDGKQARESIIQLSDLLRLSLNLGEQQRATLGEEIKLAQNYLALEKLRFDNRLTYDFNIQADMDNVLIMPMSLNTLLENAVKHGIGKLKSGGKIVITCTTDNNIATIQVENSGFYDPKPKSAEGGIGLDNLYKRLALQYGEKASLTIENDNQMVKAVIKMPF